MGSKLIIPVSQEPRLLKDFLKENSHSYSSTNLQYKKKFFEENLNATLFSNKALSKLFVRAVKYLPFASIKPPSILPRSISRRLSDNSRRNNLHGNVDVKEVSVKVKVKDILRWRSFRDLADEESPPLDFSSTPHHWTTVTTTTGSTSSRRSSWWDSDFTVEDLPLWCSEEEEEEYAGEIGVQKGKKVLSLSGLDGESMTVQSKGEWPCEEKEQNSPVSVLDFSFQKDEESFSFFHQTPTYFKPKKMRTKGTLFMSKNSIAKEEIINVVEEKAKQLLNHAKATTSKVESDEDLILLDFFMEELSTSSKHKGAAFDCELLKVAKAWMSGEDDGSLEWKMVGKREFSVRDMERGVGWNKFEEDEQELGLEMENELLNYLVDELLVDFLNH